MKNNIEIYVTNAKLSLLLLLTLALTYIVNHVFGLEVSPIKFKILSLIFFFYGAINMSILFGYLGGTRVKN